MCDNGDVYVVDEEEMSEREDFIVGVLAMMKTKTALPEKPDTLVSDDTDELSPILSEHRPYPIQMQRKRLLESQ